VGFPGLKVGKIDLHFSFALFLGVDSMIIPELGL
jgi:hypothetical protein